MYKSHLVSKHHGGLDNEVTDGAVGPVVDIRAADTDTGMVEDVSRDTPHHDLTCPCGGGPGQAPAWECPDSPGGCPPSCRGSLSGCPRRWGWVSS